MRPGVSRVAEEMGRGGALSQAVRIPFSDSGGSLGMGLSRVETALRFCCCPHPDEIPARTPRRGALVSHSTPPAVREGPRGDAPHNGGDGRRGDNPLREVNRRPSHPAAALPRVAAPALVPLELGWKAKGASTMVGPPPQGGVAGPSQALDGDPVYGHPVGRGPVAGNGGVGGLPRRPLAGG